ncbi:MAG: hypothetical protein WCS69_13315 [Ignavibacteriaceae bacterium]|jgi:hypothetical protein
MTPKNHFKVLFLSLLICITGWHCSLEVQKLPLPKKNLTSYIFPASIDSIKKIIKKHYYSTKFASDTVDFVGKELLSKPENKNDAYVWRGQDTSILYYSPLDRPVHGNIELYAHLTYIDSNSTKVEIFVPVYTISTMYNPWSNYIHLAFDDKKVPPTSIEEYQLLLKIGVELGIADEMPKIILPVRPQ